MIAKFLRCGINFNICDYNENQLKGEANNNLLRGFWV